MNNAVLEVVNPFDLKPIGEVKLVDWPTIDLWLNTASQLHKTRANWLPTPAGEFRPVLRMYEPAAAILDQTYLVPAITRV